MKKILLFLIFVTFISSAYTLSGRITYIKGVALINYQIAKLNQEVKEKDFISTKKGRLEIKLSDGTIIRIGNNTKIYLKKLKVNKKHKKVSIKVIVGNFWTKVKKLFKDDSYKVAFRTGTAGVRGTVYTLSQYKDNSADLLVFDGTVEVKGKEKKKETEKKDKKKHSLAPHELKGPEEISGPKEVTLEEWTKIVKEMMKIHISASGKPTNPVAFKKDEEKNKEWIEWNLKRDHQE